MADVNTEYYDALIEKINAVKDCTDLQGIMDEVVATITKQLQEALDIQAALGVLNSIPTDLGEVISWITNFISLNVTGPYDKAVAKHAALLTKQLELYAAITAKIAALGCVFPPPTP